MALKVKVFNSSSQSLNSPLGSLKNHPLAMNFVGSMRSSKAPKALPKSFNLGDFVFGFNFGRILKWGGIASGVALLIALLKKPLGYIFSPVIKFAEELLDSGK